MYKAKIRNSLMAALILLCFLVCGILYSNTGVNAAYAMPSSNEESKTSSASYEFRPAIEKFSYGLDEEIPIDIIFEADSPIKSLDSSANGFIEKQAPKLTQGRVTALIKASDNLNSLQYTVYANLANGSQLEANIYGIVEDGRLYVNGNSFFGARDVYMSEMLQSDKITERQYELYLKADSVDSFAETSYSVTTVPGDIDTKAASDEGIIYGEQKLEI